MENCLSEILPYFTNFFIGKCSSTELGLQWLKEENVCSFSLGARIQIWKKNWNLKKCATTCEFDMDLFRRYVRICYTGSIVATNFAALFTASKWQKWTKFAFYNFVRKRSYVRNEVPLGCNILTSCKKLFLRSKVQNSVAELTKPELACFVGARRKQIFQ
jgi:hypothetical protein